MALNSLFPIFTTVTDSPPVTNIVNGKVTVSTNAKITLRPSNNVISVCLAYCKPV